jgi:3-oxoacyl-[acyl-carrier-protein] synthase-1
MKKRIYLSAPSLICCAGQDRNELYEYCLNGNQGGLAIHTMPNCGGEYPVGMINVELPEAVTEEPAVFEPSNYAAGNRIIRIINAALEQLRPAVEKALAKYPPQRIGVCLGSCDNGSEASFMAHNFFIEKNVFPGDYDLCFQSPSFLAEFISRKFGISGPVFAIAAACASGSSAIMRGAELIRAGYCDAVIAGGADVVSEMVFSGFHALEAISDSLTNPFSKNRKGINLGEGAAFFLLDPNENSGVELLGAGESADAFHMTAPGPDGAGPVKAMEAALKNAGITSGQVGYVNLHGTGTPLNDKAESLAMKAIFGGVYPPSPPVSSTKPITGHTLGAAGALEAAICWMVLTEQKGLPVHCWDGVKDEEIPFLPAQDSDQKTPSICMSNSFGFGGCNVSLILGRVSQ